MSRGVTAIDPSPIAPYDSPLALAPDRRRDSLSLEDISSIGAKSGLYDGRGGALAPARSIASAAAARRRDFRSSKTTTSPARRRDRDPLHGRLEDRRVDGPGERQWAADPIQIR
jgi:hypothetical protein